MEQQQPYFTPQPHAAAPGYGSRYAPTNVLAIVSLVLGAASFLALGPLASVPAIVTGHIARGQIAHRGEAGARLAFWGLILGYINLGLIALVFVAGSIVFALAAHHVWRAGHPLY